MEYDDAFYKVLGFTMSEKDDLTLELASFLYKNGFALNYYTELSREYELTYNFLDDTPGVVEEEVCLHAVVDESHIPPTPKKHIDLLTLEELQSELLHNSPFSHRTIENGIITLMHRADTA